MAKLVVLSEGLTGKTQELTMDKITIGRLEDNTFQIPDASVSSHHCEVLLRGSDVVVRDLNSTNGTFINGNQVAAETALKPGQILRLGKIELRLEEPSAAAAPTPAAAAKKPADQTLVMPRGVSLNELEQGPRSGGFDTTSKAFAKKETNVNKWFIIGGIVMGVIIVALLLYAMMQVKK